MCDKHVGFDLEVQSLSQIRNAPNTFAPPSPAGFIPSLQFEIGRRRGLAVFLLSYLWLLRLDWSLSERGLAPKAHCPPSLVNRQHPLPNSPPSGSPLHAPCPGKVASLETLPPTPSAKDPALCAAQPPVQGGIHGLRPSSEGDWGQDGQPAQQPQHKRPTTLGLVRAIRAVFPPVALHVSWVHTLAVVAGKGLPRTASCEHNRDRIEFFPPAQTLRGGDAFGWEFRPQWVQPWCSATPVIEAGNLCPLAAWAFGVAVWLLFSTLPLLLPKCPCATLAKWTPGPQCCPSEEGMGLGPQKSGSRTGGGSTGDQPT